MTCSRMLRFNTLLQPKKCTEMLNDNILSRQQRNVDDMYDAYGEDLVVFNLRDLWY